MNAYYYQTADITLSGTFTPIGSYPTAIPSPPPNNPFTGTYNGQGFKISNMTMNHTGTSTGNNREAGMFLYTVGATIQNVNLVNVNIIGSRTSGGLVAYAVDSSITDCTVSGTVSRGNSGNTAVQGVMGGIVGLAGNTVVERCINYATVNNFAGSSGGIVGSMGAGFLTVSQCANHGSVTSNMNASSTALGSVSGGIVGVATYNSNSVLTIRDCYNAGSISAHNASSSTGGNPAAGGILGGIQLAGGTQTISNCYNVGTVSCTRSSSNTNNVGSGGIIGSNGVSSQANPLLVNCYSLQGTVYRLGVLNDALIGRNGGTTDGSSSPARLTNPNQSSGIKAESLMKPSQSAAAANGSIYYTGTTNGSIPGWNFTSVWIISPSVNNGYPALRSAVDLEITSSPPNTVLVTGDTFSYAPSTNVGPASYSVSGASWLTVVGGTIVGTPATEGTYTVTITATSGSKTATQTFTITVHAKLAFQTMPSGSILISPAMGVLI